MSADRKPTPAPPPAVLRLGKGALDHATQYGQEPMRFRVVMIFERCYGPDQRAMHVLQLLRGRLLHRAVNTVPNVSLAVMRHTWTRARNQPH